MRHATRLLFSAFLVAGLGGVGWAAGAGSKAPLAKAVSAGVDHTCASTRGGGVRCWGYNGHDELGIGAGSSELPSSSIPRDVFGLSGGVAAISAGTRHSCALTSTGGVKCWGVNYGGALGDGTENRYFAPVDVVGLGSGVKAVSAGYDRSCAVLETGAVKCWGTDYGLTPVDVPGLSSGIVAVATSSLIGCALTNAGGVKCWGFHYGPTAVDVPGLASGVEAVTTGGPICALTTAGGVKCWGADSNWTPVDVPGLGSGVAALATGTGHGCVVLTTGRVKCWGLNDHGQLGDGTKTDRPSPVDVVGLRGATAVATGGFHSCAVLGSGAVKCWGGPGALGDGATVERLRPVSVVDFGPAPCVVPHVVGRRLAKARALIVRAHCRVGGLSRVHSRRPKNVVVRQSVRSGKQTDAGTRIRLVVSRG
jgi:hypothetical protein